MADAGDHEMVRRKVSLTATRLHLRFSNSLTLAHVVSLQADDGDMDPELAQVSRTAVYRALCRHLAPDETLFCSLLAAAYRRLRCPWPQPGQTV